MTPNVRQPVENGDFPRALANIQDTLNGKLSVMRWIARQQDWDFGFVAVEEIDAVQHYFWHLMDAKHPDYDHGLANQYGSAIYDVYARIDTEIGDLLDYLGSDINIMVVSDHGGCANDRGNTHLEPWLEAIGLLAEHSASAQGKTESLSRRSLLGVKSWLQRVLPMGVQRRLIRRFSGVVEKTSAWRHLAKYDWTRTKAFPFGDSGIFLNVRGREPEGIVGSGEEYETLRWEIKTTLEQARDPGTDRPLVKGVNFREQEHWGPFLETAPDLLVDWTDEFVMDGIPYTDSQGQQQLAEFVRGSIFPTGVHHREGCIILHGPAFREGLKLTSPSVLDVTPTILEIMGVAIPPYMEGQPLTESLAAEYRAKEPLATLVPSMAGTAIDDNEGYSTEEHAAIEERLRNLGYLD